MTGHWALWISLSPSSQCWYLFCFHSAKEDNVQWLISYQGGKPESNERWPRTCPQWSTSSSQAPSLGSRASSGDVQYMSLVSLMGHFKPSYFPRDSLIHWRPSQRDLLLLCLWSSCHYLQFPEVHLVFLGFYLFDLYKLMSVRACWFWFWNFSFMTPFNLSYLTFPHLLHGLRADVWASVLWADSCGLPTIFLLSCTLLLCPHPLTLSAAPTQLLSVALPFSPCIFYFWILLQSLFIPLSLGEVFCFLHVVKLVLYLFTVPL